MKMFLHTVEDSGFLNVSFVYLLIKQSCADFDFVMMKLYNIIKVLTG